jgi:membrane protein implicated in regulation of membrane protease activity
MNGRSFSFGSGNPLAQILSLLVFGVLVAAAVIMGAVVLLAALGVALVAFMAFSVRVWWLRRKLRRGPPDGPLGSGPVPRQGIRYIEAEYEVVDADADVERRPERERR